MTRSRAICAAVVLIITMVIAIADAGEDYYGTFMGEFVGTGGSSVSECKGSIAECLGNGEFELESETSRRILATNKYISYGALRRNSVPCSRRGASYYNCQRGAQANPYNRGCSRISRCRG